MTEPAPEAAAETVTPEAAPQPPAEPEAATVDHESLLRELAGFVRDVATANGTIHEVLAFLASHGL